MAYIVHDQLNSNTEKTVHLAGNFGEVEVLNRDGSAEIYFTVDETAPSVEGDDCDIVPAAIGARVVTSLKDRDPTQVRLISSGTPKFSVKGSMEGE